jgi:replicative DNA helicase
VTHPGADEPTVGEWQLETDAGTLAPRSAFDVLGNVRDKIVRGDLVEYQPMPLGFTPLDRSIGGGVRPGELLLLGGAHGTGKTTMALQMARNVAAAGEANVLYICFEHEESYLLDRLIALESYLGTAGDRQQSVKVSEVRQELLGSHAAAVRGIDPIANPRLQLAFQRIAAYAERLFLMRGTATTATVDNLRRLIHQHNAMVGNGKLLVVVDYLQKVPQIPEPATETEKVTFLVNGLKDIALSEKVPVISIVAADKEGLKAARLRNHHLRGSSAINYEADIILILNEKYQIVAKVNIEFNPYQAQRFKDWIVLTVEKNRGGQDGIDFEYEKRFEFAAFEPEGRLVQEKLIEERLYND